jgi:hypothetical protein
MQEKDTDELTAIWRTKSNAEWTDEAYQVVESILIERLGVLPEPVGTDEQEEEDTYHDPDKVEEITHQASSFAALARSIAFLLISAAILIFIISIRINPSITNGYILLGIGIIVLNILFIALVCGFFSVMLKAFEESLYLLLDIEGNTRPNRK